MKTDKPRKAKKGYWILYEHMECQVCGDHDVFVKERVFDRPKPKDWEERNEIHISYCGCMNDELYGTR